MIASAKSQKGCLCVPPPVPPPGEALACPRTPGGPCHPPRRDAAQPSMNLGHRCRYLVLVKFLNEELKCTCVADLWSMGDVPHSLLLSPQLLHCAPLVMWLSWSGRITLCPPAVVECRIEGSSGIPCRNGISFPQKVLVLQLEMSPMSLGRQARSIGT